MGDSPREAGVGCVLAKAASELECCVLLMVSLSHSVLTSWQILLLFPLEKARNMFLEVE